MTNPGDANHGHRWRTSQLRMLKQMWNEGEDAGNIAKALSSTSGAIARLIVRLRQKGVDMTRRKKGIRMGNKSRAWEHWEVEFLIHHQRKGKSAAEISQELGRTQKAVEAFIKNLRFLGVDLPRRGNGPRRMWDIETLKIRGLV